MSCLCAKEEKSRPFEVRLKPPPTSKRCSRCSWDYTLKRNLQPTTLMSRTVSCVKKLRLHSLYKTWRFLQDPCAFVSVSNRSSSFSHSFHTCSNLRFRSQIHVAHFSETHRSPSYKKDHFATTVTTQLSTYFTTSGNFSFSLLNTSFQRTELVKLLQCFFSHPSHFSPPLQAPHPPRDPIHV